MKLALHNTSVDLRKPTTHDGSDLWRLVRETGVLDLNSPYAYFLLGEHFAETSVVAATDRELVGFVSAYIPPQEPNSIFVWQVGVAASMRQQGLALEMLLAILRREACKNIRTLKTTITPSNTASRSLFSSLAKRVNGSLQEQPEYLRSAWFPGNGHEAEALFTINPIRLTTTK